VTLVSDVGFWIQSEAADADDNPLTSEGVFINHRRGRGQTTPGQRLRVQGLVAEQQGITQLRQPRWQICSAGLVVPTAQPVRLPLSTQGWEALEGMRVRLLALGDDTAVAQVTAFGDDELIVSSRLHVQPGEQLAPDSLMARQRQQQYQNDRLRLAYPGRQSLRPGQAGELQNRRPLRVGNVLGQVVGVVDSFPRGRNAVYPRLLLEALTMAPLSRSEATPITAPAPITASTPITAPAQISHSSQASSLVIASFNVGNYFNGELQQNDAASGSGHQGRFSGSRGAKNQQQFDWQHQRLVATLVQINADILVLNEIENDHGADSAIEYLRRDVNRRFSEGEHYQRIPQYPRERGSDAIRNEILYRPQKVRRVGPLQVLTEAVSSRDAAGKPLFDDYGNRPVLAQVFETVPGSLPDSVSGPDPAARFTLAALHLKSKGRPCGESESQQAGAGHCNHKRTRAIEALQSFLAQPQLAESYQIIVGDFNSYAQEPPLQRLQQQGWININGHAGAKQYGYVYDGRLGNLDHMVVTSALLKKLRHFTIWNINSRENSAMSNYAGWQDETQYFPEFRADPLAIIYGSSDHDPLIATFRF
jgi:predicted extracellular nuclease